MNFDTLNGPFGTIVGGFILVTFTAASFLISPSVTLMRSVEQLFELLLITTEAELFACLQLV